MRLLSPPSSSLLLRNTLLLLLSSRIALSEIVFTSPAAGAQVPVGTISIAWEDGGGSPSLSQLKSYQIQLIVGGNDAATQIPVATITDNGRFSTGNSVSGVVQANVAGNTVNGYFLRMIADGVEGGTLTTYSSRFSMVGMTGATPALAVQAVAALGGSTAGPPAVDGLVGDVGAGPHHGGATTTTPPPAAVPPVGATVVGGVPAAAGQPYSLQTAGFVKYAPMQGIPPTLITKTNTDPLFPTSAVVIATAFLPPAQFTSTATVPQTFKVVSVENTFAAQPMPSNDMAKFLRRWKD